MKNQLRLDLKPKPNSKNALVVLELLNPLARPESLTTCHESSVGSCWTDK
jgi:hypothetical protein